MKLGADAYLLFPIQKTFMYIVYIMCTFSIFMSDIVNIILEKEEKTFKQLHVSFWQHTYSDISKLSNIYHKFQYAFQ